MTNPKPGSMHEARFWHADFQNQWKKYCKAFGKDINDLFGDDYVLKIRLAAGLEYLLHRRFYDAYHELRHLEPLCATDTDKQIFADLIRRCHNEEEMADAKVGDWVKQSHCAYCQILQRTPEGAIVKEAFDFQGTYVKNSQKTDCFHITHTDLKTYQFLEESELAMVRKFFSEHPGEESSFLKQTQTMLAYREKLLAAGFWEADRDYRQYYFYRCVAEKVAFILNLKDMGDYIRVVFGFTTVGDAAAEAFLKEHGTDDDDIKLRYLAIIETEADAEHATARIRDILALHGGCSKDEIQARKKERQKQFLQTITDKLKPLCFKKKNTTWTCPLEGDFLLSFQAQKSQWSDVYYWNISISHSAVPFPQCFATRLVTNGTSLCNWQLLSDEEWASTLDQAVNNYLLPFMRTPLAELGRRGEIWQGCLCNREKCENCWVEKNVWQANET